MIYLNTQYAKEYDVISQAESHKLESIKKLLEAKENMLDWLDVETCISVEEIKKIQNLALTIKSKYQILLIIGIGGSYLGSKAIIDIFKPYFNKTKPEIIFIGHHLSEKYLQETLEYIKGKEVYTCVISKSGNTLEPTLVFDTIYDYLKKTYNDYHQRILVITNSETGKLRELGTKENFDSLSIPDNIGGRYSILTSAGLLPIAVAGIDIEELIEGAHSVRNCYQAASRFALIRHHLENDNKTVEAITFYEDNLSSFAAWYQQLFAETQGKDGKGILPIINQNTTNLHSLGQYFQEGRKQVFETVIRIQTKDKGINPIISKINETITFKVAEAHYEGNTPSIILSVDKLDTNTAGQLIYFLELSAAIGGYLLDINPFDQPGVERYKTLLSENL